LVIVIHGDNCNHFFTICRLVFRVLYFDNSRDDDVVMVAYYRDVVMATYYRAVREVIIYP
jgi:hypothetical protein